MQRSAASPDPAWRILELVNSWIRHADAKIGVVVAASGAVAVALYNVVAALPRDAPWWSYLAPAACAGFLPSTALCCERALRPRTTPPAPKREKQGPRNPLYFKDVATEWTSKSYTEELRQLGRDTSTLTVHIATQIHVNSQICTTKYEWADKAVRSLVAAMVLLGVSAIVLLALR